MSLLTQWEEIKSQINTENEIINEIYEKNPEYYFEHQNQWRAKRYPKSSSKGTATPTKSDITSYVPQALTYRATSDRSYDWRWADSYIGYMECYIYCNTATTLSFTYCTDDAGQIWLNDSTLRSFYKLS